MTFSVLKCFNGPPKKKFVLEIYQHWQDNELNYVAKFVSVSVINEPYYFT